MNKISAAVLCSSFCLFVGLQQAKATASICDAVAGNLVANCGFETGDFTGWTLTGHDVPGELNNLYGVEGTDPLDGIAPNSGMFQTFIADLSSNPTTLSQTLATVAGGGYTITFFLAQDTSPTSNNPNKFSASFDGNTLASLASVPMEGYTEYLYYGSASSTSTVFSLTLGNDLGEFLLDDVSVVSGTPEPSPVLLVALSGLAAFLLWRKVAART
jgi:hypothetical protein